MEINQCIEYMKNKHNGQKRKQGTPYYTHPLKVCEILKEKGFSEEYQIVGLFHDLLEDTDATYEEILTMTTPEIANAVKLLTKEKDYIMSEYIARIKRNNIAKAVKLADRVHNLSETILASRDFQDKYIKETEDWYIDLARETVFEKDLKSVLMELKKLQ